MVLSESEGNPTPRAGGPDASVCKGQDGPGLLPRPPRWGQVLTEALGPSLELWILPVSSLHQTPRLWVCLSAAWWTSTDASTRLGESEVHFPGSGLRHGTHLQVQTSEDLRVLPATWVNVHCLTRGRDRT